jgi:hypothetical protein
MIPHYVHGKPVKYFAQIEPPLFPRGYPGDGPIEKTTAFLISISDEGHAGDERFWVNCLGISGKLMGGEMCYTLESAMAFPEQEFEVQKLVWKEAGQGGRARLE